MKKLLFAIAFAAAVPAAFAAEFDLAGYGGDTSGGVQVAFSGGADGTWTAEYSSLTLGFEKGISIGREEADPNLGRMWNVDFSAHPEVFSGATAYLMNTGAAWGKGGKPIAKVDVSRALASAPVSNGTVTFSGVPWDPSFDKDGDGLYWGMLVVLVDAPAVGQRAWLHHPGFELKNNKLVATGPYAAFTKPGPGQKHGNPVTVIGLHRQGNGSVKMVPPPASIKAAVSRVE